MGTASYRPREGSLFLSWAGFSGTKSLILDDTGKVCFLCLENHLGEPCGALEWMSIKFQSWVLHLSSPLLMLGL